MDNFNFDVIKILGYGAAGLSFLLMFLAYNLIQKEQRIKKPRREIVNMVYMYMFFTLMNIVIVGFVGLPALRDNSFLASRNDSLKLENHKVSNLYELQKNNSILTDNINNLSGDSIVKLISENAKKLDTLAKNTENPVEKQNLMRMRLDLLYKIDSLKKVPAANKRDSRKILRDIKNYKSELDKLVD